MHYFGDSKNATGTYTVQGQTATLASATDVDGFVDMLPDDDGFPFM